MLRRIFIKGEITDDSLIYLDKKSINHAINVLRLKNNGKFIAVDGNGNEYISEIADYTKGIARIISINKSESNRVTAVNLYLAVIKQQRFEIALEKCTELGVNSVTPVKCKNSLPLDITENRVKRFNTILEQASRQCGRLHIPLLHTASTFEKVITVGNSEETLIAHSTSENDNITVPNITTISAHTSYNIFIGPEGGFTAEEINIAIENNAKIINLGQNILRTETAAIAVCSFIMTGPFLHKGLHPY